MLISVKRQCPICGEINMITVDEDGLNSWEHGTHAQDAFPYLNDDEREMMITGICPSCWEKVFADMLDD